MSDGTGIASTSSKRFSPAAPRFLCLLLVSSLSLAAESAATRTITLRWRQPGLVAGFKVYTRHVDQPYTAGIDIGLPTQENGIFVHRLEVSNLDATYISISAYAADGTEGPRSDEVLYLLPE